ncbi:hypothetical protein H0H87_010011 [Tephrocybe sp. NHM501043]|nr:hypothetical protein H0H87_010011 [Tephrocybe sp. NHM501043]
MSSKVYTSTSVPVEPAVGVLRSLSDFDIKKLFGKGHTGKVYLAVDKVSQAPVAIKVVPKTPGHNGTILREQAIHKSLQGCSFSAPLLASWEDDKQFYLVTPYYPGSDLAINLGAAGVFGEARVKFYTAELIVALEELKARDILHRDIKPANIAFTPSGHLRLLDFGCATRLEGPKNIVFDVDPSATSGSFHLPYTSFTSTERVGTAPYMSVEQHLGCPYSFEADLHAVGVIVYQMFTGRLPFGHGAGSQEEVMAAVVGEQLGFRPEDKVSAEGRSLISLLLRRDSRRPTNLEQVMSHSFFEGVRWESVRSQTTTPPWKPLVGRLPKQSTGCLSEGGLCELITDTSFLYISPHLLDARARATETIFNRISRLFGKNSHLPTPSPPPSPPPTVTANFSLPINIVSSPPTMSLPPFPATTPAFPVGGPLPAFVLEGLRQRKLASSRVRPKPDVPILVVTAAEAELLGSDWASSQSTCDSPGDLSDSSLSPAKAEDPSWNPPLPSGPEIRRPVNLKAKRLSRKENKGCVAALNPVSDPKSSRTPLTMVSMPQNGRQVLNPKCVSVKPLAQKGIPQKLQRKTSKVAPYSAPKTKVKVKSNPQPMSKIGVFGSSPPRHAFQITRPRSPLPASRLSPPSYTRPGRFPSPESSDKFNSDKLLVRSYGVSIPKVNLEPDRSNNSLLVVQERRKVIEDYSVYSALRASTPPLKIGPHYKGELPSASPQGVLQDLCRLWIRISMGFRRTFSQIAIYIEKTY